MGKQLHLDTAAEKEATAVGRRFMNSTDVVGDMSRAYGADLSSVRIHTDESAARRAAERGVDAYSTGKDVFFGQGVFDRSDPASRGLLAHELSHSLQQGVGGGDMGGLAQSAPMGAEQGGLIDWFKSKFGRKKKNIDVSAPTAAMPNTSADSMKYMEAMRRHDLIRNMATPAAHVGEGGAQTVENLQAALNIKNEMGLTYIDRSNAAFRKGDRAGARVDLGIRDSSEKPSQVEKGMRGDIYEGLKGDYDALIYSLQQAGLDMGDMLENEKIESAMVDMGNGKKDKLGYAVGAGFDALNHKALDMFSNYVLSDESLSYIEKFTKAISQAELFNGENGGVNSASGFVLQTLVNTVGGNVHGAITDDRLNPASKRVAVNMGRTIGSLPKMAMVPDKNLPESLRPLRARYFALQEELDRRLAQRQGD